MHPIQDIYAHTDDVCHFRQITIPVKTYYKYGLYNQYETYRVTYEKVYAWEHISTLNVKVDSAKNRPDQLKLTAEETTNILKKYYNRYSDIWGGF